MSAIFDINECISREVQIQKTLLRRIEGFCQNAIKIILERKAKRKLIFSDRVVGIVRVGKTMALYLDGHPLYLNEKQKQASACQGHLISPHLLEENFIPGYFEERVGKR